MGSTNVAGVRLDVDSVDGASLLVWRCTRPWLAISSAVLGGGIGRRHWVLNATVGHDYDRNDPRAHLGDLAAARELSGDGVGMMTAVDVRTAVTRAEGGVVATVTTGIGAHPTWAAGDGVLAWAPGTINVVAWLPVRLSDAALVNAVATVAEAKAQALGEAGVPGTGTMTDATALFCPPDGRAEPYGGPRSLIGSPLARVVHAAIHAGLRGDPKSRDDLVGDRCGPRRHHHPYLRSDP